VPVRSETVSTATQCPQCGTRFKASQAQLEAYHGMVRCGHCQAVFNAIAHGGDDDDNPQLALPIMLDEPPLHARSRINADGRVATRREPVPGAYDAYAGDYPELSVKRTWPWAVGSIVLSAVMLAQAAYFFRVELAARLPGLKPALMAGCKALRCDIPLPQDADLMSIESSDLEADPAQAGVITLSFTLRNRASYAQAYPNLELTLNDINDVTVGRRSLHPAEYLKNPEDEKNGLASNRENAVRLTLDTTGIQAAGYRLFLYY
jgi:predicted Zn finger-like uncharacterized protein